MFTSTSRPLQDGASANAHGAAGDWEARTRQLELQLAVQREQLAQLNSNASGVPELDRLLGYEKELRELERDVDLLWEVHDPLPAALVTINLTHWYQRPQPAPGARVASSLVCGLRLFNCPPFVSARVPLTVPTECTHELWRVCVCVCVCVCVSDDLVLLIC